VTWVYVVVVLALIVVNALFSAAEMGLVTLRDSQVRALAEQGRRGHRLAKLVSEPNRFLSAIQIGITVASLLASAFGAATLSRQASDALAGAGVERTLSNVVGFLGVTLLIAYVTLVIGELVPKRIGLQRAEATALLLAGFTDRVATLSRPVIWAASALTNLLVRLLGGDPSQNKEPISESELRDIVTSHEALTRDERTLIDEVFAAGDRQVREVMVPRTEVEFLDSSTTLARAAKLTQPLSHSRFPVVRGSHDDVVGFVHVRDLIRENGSRRGARVADVTRDVAQLPATRRVLPALSDLRREGQHLAVVVDEYGGTAGIVTLEDLIEELVGEIRDEYDVGGAQARQLRGGDVEVDGLLNLDEFAEQTGLELPDGPYETAGGYVMAALGRLPRKGDAVEAAGARLTVTEMDSRRVARMRVTSLAPEPEPEPAAAVEVVQGAG
jgi:putative hemolysin